MGNSFFVVLSFFDDLMSNTVDLIFFISIISIILLLVVLLIVSKVVDSKKNKKYKESLENTPNQEAVPADEEPSAEEVEEPVAEETEEPVAEETEEEPVAEETVEEPAVEEAEEEPVAEETVEEPAVEEAEEEPVAEEVVEEPAVEETEEPVAEEVAEEPAVEETEEPVAEEVAEEPAVEETEEPVAEEVVEEPAVEETEEPVVEEVVEEPAVEETEEPVAEEVVEEPVVKKTPAKKAPAKKAVAKKEESTGDDTKKGRSYNGKYEVFQLEDSWYYTLKASNGEVLVNSEGYTSRDGVLKAIGSIKRNIETGTVRIDSDKNGQYQFKLIAKNYRVLAVSANYSTEKSAERASESFKKFAEKADIIDIEITDTKKVGTSAIVIEGIEEKLGGKYTLEFDGEKYSWDLIANNGQILCQQNGYTTKAGCLKSVESFKSNVANGSFKCIKDKNNCFAYKLYSASGRICAVGESYNSKTSAESAARSVVGFYKNAEIVDNTEAKEE